MQLKYVKSSDETKLVLTHLDNPSLSFDGKSYNFTTDNDRHNAIDPINGYWASLPDERQNVIFDIYTKIDLAFKDYNSIESLNATLIHLCHDLLQQHPAEELSYFMRVKYGFIVPTSVYDVMPASAVTEEAQLRTYLKNDYIELLELSLRLRPMYLVWSEWLRQVNNRVPRSFKEHVAFSLLQRSDIIDSHAMQRLMMYVESSLSKSPVSNSAIIGGLGTSELPEWFRSGIIVKRICIGTLKPTDDKKHIVAEMYKYLNSTITTLDRKFEGIVKDKEPIGSGSEEDNMSISEMVKVKETVPIGDTVIFTAFAKELENNALAKKPDINMDLVRRCVERAVAAEINLTDNFHQVLVQYCFGGCDILSANGIESLNDIELKGLLGVAQAVLIEQELYDLAVLITANPLPRKPGVYAVNEIRFKVEPTIVQALLDKYPFAIPEPGSKSATQLNPALKAMELIAKEAIKTEWMLTCEPELIAKSSYKSKRCNILSNFKNELGKFILLNC